MQAEIKMSIVQCARCHIPFAVSEEFERSLRKCHNTFYCPQGHPMSYPHKTDEEILQSKLKNAQNELEQLKADIEVKRRTELQKRRAATEKARITKSKKKNNKGK